MATLRTAWMTLLILDRQQQAVRFIRPFSRKCRLCAFVRVNALLPDKKFAIYKFRNIFAVCYYTNTLPKMIGAHKGQVAYKRTYSMHRAYNI